ncbi:3-hydroxyacyl-CoA dehydrogenase [Candidatus Koribacter versatilis Ellin345]|uniref:3-hydroxyacyl-CoA dehydrogenase n=1 Tax=Koribacter versatilis (strain Ellin345) TaxID=204669 RepID=Q1INT0_KORVE|nr:3-hydroxyacyl-CoA dehydrogenase/enoyl-CoA hydratase family protein [Candidatus Koribacter versatilis]ABF41470.1 3-hydroxyacyl-CoA dehydrogenase [Candidatus Koribacter versatilis Ellin345]
MLKRIEKVAVLGAGTMGARIAAHFANAGIPSYLFDIVPPDADGPARNKIAAAGLDAAKKSKPAAFFHPDLAKLVTVGNFEDDLKKLGECDWIIEAVVENLELKRALLKKVEAVRKPGSLITTNTSGLPVSKISEGFSEDFRRNWFGTHFFNPPRYMRLLELIPTPDTDPKAMEAVAHLGDVQLGKGIVHAKDTPNFIGNRIGTFSVLNVIRVMQEMDLSIEDVDALTGSAVGWPKSATFRTIDLVGLDILGHVVGNMKQNVTDERSDLQIPDFYKQMLERKWLGDKTKGGFYKKQKGPQGEERMALDWKTLEYHPRSKPKFPALEVAKTIETTPERVKALLGLDGNGPQKGDKAGQFLWTTLTELWTYAANRIPEISDTIVEIDAAMRMGFNWEMGPFELWDAAGVEATVGRMKAEGKPVPANVEKLFAAGKTRWYDDSPKARSGRCYFDIASGEYKDVPVANGVWSVEVAKKQHKVVKKNAGASLVDLGNGVGCIEFHSKMNSLGGDIIQMVSSTLKPGGPGDHFDAFVITNDAGNFSVGANIMMLLMAVQEQEWDEVDMMIRQFQNMTAAIKFSQKPVVVAPFGMTLGGGCEIVLHAPARQPHAELYCGLVEVGVGLLPGGGGCKEMTLRAVDAATRIRPDGRGESVEMMEAFKKAFETIAMAKVSTSAVEAKGLGFIHRDDNIIMNRERILFEAKAKAIEMVREGYKPPVPRTDVAVPGESVLATLKLGVHIMRQGEFITDHEVKIGNKVADVLCGGNVTPGSLVSEQYLLDLEREGFKSLCGEKKTQERIQFTLKTGKPLRN